MIKNIKLKFGRADGLEAVAIDTTPITVFVGPNNSGKSKILSEIQQFCSNGIRNANGLIIDTIELEAISNEVVNQRIAKVSLRPNPGEALQPDHKSMGSDSIETAYPPPKPHAFLQHEIVGSHFEKLE